MSKLKIENAMSAGRQRKLQNFITFFASLVFAFGAISCEQLQNSLSSEQQAKMDEETGNAYLDGSTWYFDGSSSTDFSNTTGASLALKFTKKVAVSADKEISDSGVVTYNSHLSGSIAASYTKPSG